jgi:hypothetical protein
MTQHNHRERVPGCFRCDLSEQEVKRGGHITISQEKKPSQRPVPKPPKAEST